MPLTTAIADAVAAELNREPPDRPLPAGVIAQRRVRPRRELRDLKDLAVTVVPRSVTTAGATRGLQQFDVEVDVAVQQRVAPDSDAAVEPLLQLVEDLTLHLSRRRLPAFPTAAVVAVRNSPLYAVEHLDELSVFTSVLTLTYRLLQ